MATRLYDSAEVARKLGYSPWYVRWLARQGLIACMRIGRGHLRFTDEHLAEFLRANTKPARRDEAS